MFYKLHDSSPQEKGVWDRAPKSRGKMLRYPMLLCIAEPLLKLVLGFVTICDQGLRTELSLLDSSLIAACSRSVEPPSIRVPK